MVKTIIQQIEQDLMKDLDVNHSRAQELLDNDEISPAEEAFLRGYDEAS